MRKDLSITESPYPGEPADPLEKSLLDTLRNTELREVLESGAELIVDALLKEGVARDIPIVSTITGLARTGLAIRDRLFITKLLQFLHPFAKYSADERRQYLNSLEPKELNKASQYLILYIERLDSIEKAWMLSKVFEAYMLKKITYRSMLYFTHFVDAVFILVWQDFHTALKNWRPHRPAHPLKIATADALALEKVGFYVEQTEPVRTELVAGQTMQDTQLKGIRRKLILSNPGWEFIETVLQPLWPATTNRGYLRDAFSITLNQV